MTETWVRERFQTFAAEPDVGGGPTEELLHRGRLQRGRQSRRRVATATMVLIVAGLGVSLAVTRSATTPAHPATLGTAAGTPDGRDAPYWLDRAHYSHSELGADGALTTVDDGFLSNWLGHDRGSVSANGIAPHYDQPTLVAAYGSAPGPGPFHPWDAQWITPTDRHSVLDYLAQIHAGLPSDAPGRADEATVLTGAEALTEPGPVAFRKAVIAAMAALPEVAASPATDERGRAATLLTFTEPGTDGRFLAYVDEAAGTLLETVRLEVGPGPNGLAFARQPRMEAVWDVSGPADNAPAATTIEQQDAAASIPANPDPAHPTCTAGKPDGQSAIAIQLAAVCLSDPAPGFPYRVVADYFNSNTNRVFQVSTEPVAPADGTGTIAAAGRATSDAKDVDIRVRAGGTLVLAGATSPTPDAAGMVGHDRAVGTAQALGVTATEVVDPEGHLGLVMNVHGLGVELVGGSSYDQLVTLADSMHIGA